MSSVDSNIQGAKPKLQSIKVLFLGDSSVGKSSIISRFADGQFIYNTLSTCGIDFKIRTIDLEGEQYKLQLWDTAGQERYRCITPSFYRSAHSIMLVYDSTSTSSFENVKIWMTTIAVHSVEGINVVLVANKCDLKQVITKEQGQALADKYNVKFMEVSAKTGQNVTEAIYLIAKQGKNRLDTVTSTHNQPEPIQLIPEKTSWRDRCCG
eukprot:TRINITY_DN22804_c0_g1_i1.p1 TRINITY_DN22804_c0_g1~~TRINITY_DN22804_c0_g1_i1.p1  ORF type:complete len:209 (-),score=49.99 TRINITY_DN22804_c0_g1_i1:90-716(-)